MIEVGSVESERRLRRFLNNRALLNAVASVTLQIVTIINGLIVPRLILESFGSELNGIVLSINQFLSYISLAEGGVTGVVSASLYRALRRRDMGSAKSIYDTMTFFCKRIAWLFLGYITILSVVFAVVFRSEFNSGFVFLLVWVLALVQIVQYGFALAPRTLLNADKKVYVVAFVQIGMCVLSLILTIVCIRLWPNILLLKIATGLCYLIQPIVFYVIIKRRYNWHLRTKRPMQLNRDLLKKRWDGLLISFAAFIHNNTDIVILTIFASYLEVSVYGVYLLVTAGIRGLVQAISRGIAPSLGHVLASGDKAKIRRSFSKYRWGMFGLITTGFILAFVLIRPFINFYTRDIVDVDYDRPVFAILMLTAEMVYLLRESHVNLAYAAGKFKELSWVCATEAAINIVASLIAVQFWKLEGVALGTLVAMIWRTLYQVVYSHKILNDNIS